MAATGYRTEVVRLSSGERFPLLINEATGVPDSFATWYTLSNGRTRSYNTSRHWLDSIGILYDWAEHQGIDLEQRFGSGSLFNVDEVDALADRLRRDRRDLSKVVIADTHGNRVNAVKKYIKWRADRTITRMRIDDDRIDRATARCATVMELLSGHAVSGGSKKRIGLTEEQQRFFLGVIRPDSPDNPFHPKVRWRNYALLLLHFELGVRKGEPLVMKAAHVNTLGARPNVQIFPNPNDAADPRDLEPRVKTASRILQISDYLCTALDRYISEERAKVPNRKKTSFVFLSSRNGRPLSLAASYDIFVTLRKAFPTELPGDFASHILRHTANGRFTAAVIGDRILTEDEARLIKHARNYLFGWKKHSEQSENYDTIMIQRETERVLLAMQSQLTAVVS